MISNMPLRFSGICFDDFLKIGTENTKSPNILNRQFTAICPLSRIVTNITHFYLFTTLNNITTLFAISTYLTTSSSNGTSAQLKPCSLSFLPWDVCCKEKGWVMSPMLLHSDQGSQYSSAGFHSLLKLYNVTQSISRAGTPHDNAVMESVFGWFKEFLRAEYLNRSDEPIQQILE